MCTEAFSLWIERPERESDHSPLSNTEVKKGGVIPPPSYAFMGWCVTSTGMNFSSFSNNALKSYVLKRYFNIILPSMTRYPKLSQLSDFQTKIPCAFPTYPYVSRVPPISPLLIRHFSKYLAESTNSEAPQCVICSVRLSLSSLLATYKYSLQHPIIKHP
jgi:hypothetical protein